MPAKQTAKEIFVVDTTRPACDGGDGPMGHPRVYLSLTDKPAIDCPYCGRRFVQSQDAAQGVH